MDIHLCIVTGQPLANLIPLMQYRPQQVALVVSDEMKDQADRFIRVLRSENWDHDSIHVFDGLPSDGYENILHYAMQVYEQLESRFPDAHIVYNATGGNKLMALAFSQWFAADRRNDIIYADTANHKIEVISAGRERSEPMKPVLDLALYLKAQGKTLRTRQDQDEDWLEKAQRRKPATRYLAEHYAPLKGLVSLLNRTYGGDNNRDGASPTVLRLDEPPRGEWKKALELLQAGGVLDTGDSGQDWYPVTGDAARYLSGAWLEEYVYFAARDAGAEEVALNVVFTDDSQRKSDIRNELDVWVVHNNQLLVIECKAGRIARQERKDQDTVYKLDSLSDQVGGLLGARALVSFWPLEHRTREGRSVDVRARARSVHIFTCEAEELPRLRARIRHWMEDGRWQDQ